MRLSADKDEMYWQKRNEELEAEWHRRSQKEIEKELAGYYVQALKHIEKNINDLYTRFAIDNSMSMTEAYCLLQGDEFRVWRMDMQEYLKQIEDTGDKKLLRELNTLAMRSRISRLDKLKSETYAELSKLAGKFEKNMDKFLSAAYKDFYYRNLFEIGKRRGLDATPVKVDSKEMEKILRTPWSGKNYSERIWANQERLGKVICNEIASAMHRGSSVEKTSQIIAQKMNVGIHDAKRLVRTELNYVQNRAALDSIRDSGMKYYRFIATLDKRTSTVCRAHDGKIYPVGDGSPGTNMPPLHPHCRSTIAGSLKGDSSNKGQRAARGQDGKTCKVPSNMSYRDWERVYVKKEISLDDWKNSLTKENKNVIIDISNPQNYRKVERIGEAVEVHTSKHSFKVNRLAGMPMEMYLSEKASLKPKEAHTIHATLKEVVKMIDAPKDAELPRVYIVSPEEMRATASYLANSNNLFIVQGVFTKDFESTGYAGSGYLSTAIHEMLHWKDAQEYVLQKGKIADQGKYLRYRIEQDRKILEKLGIKEEQAKQISKYAEKMFKFGRYDEVYAEYRTADILKG